MFDRLQSCIRVVQSDGYWEIEVYGLDKGWHKSDYRVFKTYDSARRFLEVNGVIL